MPDRGLYDHLKQFDVSEEDMKNIGFTKIISNDGEKILYHVCPFCFPNKKKRKKLTMNQYSFNNISKDKNNVIQHMAICIYNPDYLEYKRRNSIKYKKMEDSISDNNKFGKQKFMMGKGHYHKLFSKPSDTKENLIYVSHGNDICYKGVIPNIPQLSEVIWPKDNVRELSKEEISRFHGSTIRIDQWINCKIDIVNNTITTEVIRPGFDIPRGEA